MSRILVLDANQRSALAVVRSLGRHGELQVFTADETPQSLAGHSRYSEAYFQYPSPGRESHAFGRWLAEFVASRSIQWVFPVTEITSQTVLLLRGELASCRVPLAGYETVMALANKWNLIQLARRLNVAHPATKHVEDAAGVQCGSIARFPVVLKPDLSRLRLAEGWLATSVHVAADREELSTLLSEKVYFRDHPFLVQEYIPGNGAGLFALYDQGKALAFFAHRRLREKPPTGGVSVLSESTLPDPEMLEMARKLLDAARWHGVAMVEFRVTPEGKPYLMEVNTRFWGSLQLAIDAGVDFPYWLYQLGNGEMPAIPTGYRVGRRLRWLLGDVDSLYLALRGSACLPWTAKLRRLADFLTPRPWSTRHEIDRRGDPGPAWYELKSYLAQILRRN